MKKLTIKLQDDRRTTNHRIDTPPITLKSGVFCWWMVARAQLGWAANWGGEGYGFSRDVSAADRFQNCLAQPCLIQILIADSEQSLIIDRTE